MSENVTRDEIIGQLDGLVEELLDRAGILGPQVDAISLARKEFGMEVRLEPGGSSSKRKQRDQGKQPLVLDPDMREEHRQWTAAHAIGVHLKSEISQRMGSSSDQLEGIGGSLANLFAQRLLVTQHWLADEVRRCDYDLLLLKERFSSASHEVIALRLLDLSDPCIITIVDNDHITRRRSNAWQVRKQLAPPEKQVQQYVSQYSRPQYFRESGWTVQGWPIHQTDWRREILRSVIDDEEALLLAFVERRRKEDGMEG